MNRREFLMEVGAATAFVVAGGELLLKEQLDAQESRLPLLRM